MIQQGSRQCPLAAKTTLIQGILDIIRTISVQGQTELVTQVMPTGTTTVATTTALVMIPTPRKTLVHHPLVQLNKFTIHTNLQQIQGYVSAMTRGYPKDVTPASQLLVCHVFRIKQ